MNRSLQEGDATLTFFLKLIGREGERRNMDKNGNKGRSKDTKTDREGMRGEKMD